MSPFRAAGRLHSMTVKQPSATMPGPAGMHGGSEHGVVCEVIVAAFRLLIITVAAHELTIVSMMQLCGVGVGVGAGGWIGAWQCGLVCLHLSVWRAAAGMGAPDHPTSV